MGSDDAGVLQAFTVASSFLDLWSPSITKM